MARLARRLGQSPFTPRIVYRRQNREESLNSSRSQRKSVYVAYTGGTIGMRPSERGYRPEPGLLANQMARLPVLADPRMPTYTVHEYAPLLDSSNMTPDDWVKIAEDIFEQYHRYDGFIVLHGTDTMAFSASATLATGMLATASPL